MAKKKSSIVTYRDEFGNLRWKHRTKRGAIYEKRLRIIGDKKVVNPEVSALELALRGKKGKKRFDEIFERAEKGEIIRIT